MKTKFLRLMSLSALGLLSLTNNQAFAADDTCDIDRPVVFADLDWDSNAFHTEVARFILENGYGCKTDSLPGSTIPLLNGMVKGDIDITMEIWPENVAEPWGRALKRKQVVDVSSNFSAKQAWYVPKYLVEGDDAPAKGLKSVSDLPKYKALFKDPEQPEKGRFYNCIAGWGCETINSKKLIAYDLEKDFVNFRPGTGAALNAAIESGIKRKKPIVFYYWGPSWIMGKVGDEIVELEEKPYDESIWKAMKDSDKPTDTTAYPIVDVRIGANRKFSEAAPNIIAFLKQYQTSAEQVSTMLGYMQDTGSEVKDTAKYFLKNNTEQWTPWVPATVAERVKKAL